MEPDEFFELVQSIRRRVQDSYEDDTLIEAIAVELERDHGFIFVSDERLTAAVNVSIVEEENFLAEVEPRGRGRRGDATSTTEPSSPSSIPTASRPLRQLTPGAATVGASG